MTKVCFVGSDFWPLTFHRGPHRKNIREIFCKAGGKGRAYNLSDYRVMKSFVGAIAERLGLSSTRIRLPESLIRMLLNLFRVLPAIPLSEARVDVLTGRTVYFNEKI